VSKVEQVNSVEKRQLLQSYNSVSNVRGLIDLVVHWGAIILVFCAVYYTQSVLLGLLAVPIIAGLQNSLASLAHETFHYKVFTSRKLNSITGGFLYSYPLGVPFQNYRKRHLEHHRNVGYRNDPDWGNYQGRQFESVSSVYGFFASKLLGSYLFVNVYTLLSGKNPPMLLEGQAESSTKDLVYLAVTQLVLLALVSIFFSWWMYFVFWLLPLVTLTAFLIGVRAYLEHNDPDEDSGVDVRLFDYRPNWLEHFFISPCHFHLHAIHHAFPAVPHYRLDAMKAELGQRGIDYPCQDRAGYIECFFAQVKKLGAASRAPF
jgi:fatty acid desaturase